MRASLTINSYLVKGRRGLVWASPHQATERGEDEEAFVPEAWVSLVAEMGYFGRVRKQKKILFRMKIIHLFQKTNALMFWLVCLAKDSSFNAAAVTEGLYHHKA